MTTERNPQLSKMVEEAVSAVQEKGLEGASDADKIIAGQAYVAQEVKAALEASTDKLLTSLGTNMANGVAAGIEAGVANCRRETAEAEKDWKNKARRGGPWAGAGAALTGLVWALKEIVQAVK